MADAKNEQGRLPGRQTEQPNAGPEFDARADLDRQKHLPEGVRERLQVGHVDGAAHGLSKADDDRDLSGPKGAAQEREHHKRGGGS